MRVRILLGVAVVGVMASGACARVNPDKHVNAADGYMAQGLFGEAVIEYRVAAQAAPKRADIHMKLADAYIRSGHYSEGIQEASRASDLQPNDVTAHVKVGNLLLLARDFNGAKDHADRALTIDPDNVDATLLLGNSQAGLKNFADAIREYEDAIALQPSDGQPYVNLGSVLLVQGKRSEAEATFRKAISMSPKSPIGYLGLANLLWTTGRVDEAEKTIKSALAIAPNDLEANRAIVVLYLATRRPREAERYIRMLVHLSDTVQAHLYLADYYLTLKQPDDARKVLLELASRADGYVPANVRLAAFEGDSGQRAQALARLEEVLKRFPKDTSARLVRAILWRDDGKSDQALIEARDIIKAEPMSTLAASAYSLIGEIAAESDRFEEAVAAYEEVLKRDSHSNRGLLALAALYLSKGNLDKSSGYLTQALSLDPKNLPARALRVRLLLAQGDRAGAANALEALRHDAPDLVVVQNLQAAEQLAAGQFSAARATYAKALDGSPNDVEATAGLVQLDLATGHTKAALDRIEPHLAAKPPSPNFLILAAQTYDEIGQGQKVEESLKKAIEVAPDKMAGYSMLGFYYAKQHRLDEAREEFEELVRRNPKSISAGTMLGMVLESLNRQADAEKRYQTVLLMNPQAPIAANNLSYIYLSTNRNLETAFELAQTAHQESPGDAHISDTLGWAYYQKKQPRDAVRNLEDSVKIDPTNPNAQYHLGMAYVQAGDPASARRALQKVIALKNEEQSDAAKKAMDELNGKGQVGSTIR